MTRPADSTRRAGTTDDTRHIAIGSRSAIRDCPQSLPHTLPEDTAAHAQRQVKGTQPPVEVCIELPHSLSHDSTTTRAATPARRRIVGKNRREQRIIIGHKP